MTSFAAAFEVVGRAVRGGPIPSAVAVAGTAGGEDATFAVGDVATDGPAATPDTWYDLASLTKVLCTVPLCLEQVVAGRIDPRAPLRALLPEAGWLQAAPSLADASVLELATHTSGLPAWQPLYTLGLDRSTLFAHVLHTPLTDARGSIVYSDLGFIVLGHLLERIGGQPLATLAAGLFGRLGLAGALGFAPNAGTVAPTEACPWRGRVLQGEVHDENAGALGGAAGHAGLFGTARGVAGFARALLEGRLLPEPVAAYMVREHAREQRAGGERRAFGWALSFPGWSGGDFTSERAIGHTGFTGTGLWIDLERGRYSVLLSNRVHPSRHVDPDGIVRLRRAFNHAVFGTP